MAVMVSRVLSCLVCVLCSLLIQTVWAEFCTNYVDANGIQQPGQQCDDQFCCGNCYQRFCCTDRRLWINEEYQQRCAIGGGHWRSKPTLLGSILGAVFLIIVAVVFLIYKCRKGRS